MIVLLPQGVCHTDVAQSDGRKIPATPPQGVMNLIILLVLAFLDIYHVVQ